MKKGHLKSILRQPHLKRGKFISYRPLLPKLPTTPLYAARRKFSHYPAQVEL